MKTKLADLINPEVMSDMVSAAVLGSLKFTALANVDTTLEGVAGNTLTLPKYNYIGDATEIVEGDSIAINKLTSTSEKVTIKQVAKGVAFYDAAILSGLGDPIKEGVLQLSKAIQEKIDNDLLAALDTTTQIVEVSVIDVDAVDKGLANFDTDLDENVVLLANYATLSKLKKELTNGWDSKSEFSDNIIMSGTIGGLLGAQVVRSKKIADDVIYLVKPGALGLYIKRDLEIEPIRDGHTKSTDITADQYYAVHLFNDNKAVKIMLGE